MISTIGNRYDKSGPLVNISKGGDGGDNFTNNPRKEEIREIHRKNALGSNNNMYGLPLEEYPSHKAKLRGEHWNMVELHQHQQEISYLNKELDLVIIELGKLYYLTKILI